MQMCGHAPDARLATTLVRVCSQHGQALTALGLYDWMRAGKAAGGGALTPTVFTYTAAMRAALAGNLLPRAFQARYAPRWALAAALTSGQACGTVYCAAASSAAGFTALRLQSWASVQPGCRRSHMLQPLGALQPLEVPWSEAAVSIVNRRWVLMRRCGTTR